MPKNTLLHRVSCKKKKPSNVSRYRITRFADEDVKGNLARHGKSKVITTSNSNFNKATQLETTSNSQTALTAAGNL